MNNSINPSPFKQLRESLQMTRSEFTEFLQAGNGQDLSLIEHGEGVPEDWIYSRMVQRGLIRPEDLEEFKRQQAACYDAQVKLAEKSISKKLDTAEQLRVLCEPDAGKVIEFECKQFAPKHFWTSLED